MVMILPPGAPWLCGLALGFRVREVGRGERPVKFNRQVVIGASRSFSGGKAASRVAFPVRSQPEVPRVRPATFVEVHTKVRTGSVGFAVLPVLGQCCDAEVDAPVVQRVAVDVINDLTGPRAKQLPMQANHRRLAALPAPDCVQKSSVRGERVPTKPAQFGEVLVINERRHAICQMDFARHLAAPRWRQQADHEPEREAQGPQRPADEVQERAHQAPCSNRISRFAHALFSRSSA